MPRRDAVDGPQTVADPARTARPGKRQRNLRGQGARLRDEIIVGAAALLDRTGSEASISMRAVAREVGIAPPSMAPHFADRAEIIDAVVSRELTCLHEALVAAIASEADPVDKALAGARAYVTHGQAHPNRYRMIFERRCLDLWDREQRGMAQTAPLTAETFDVMVGTIQECIDAGRSASTDAFGDGVRVWLALHGLIALPQTITSFPWPDIDELLVSCVCRLARIEEDRR